PDLEEVAARTGLSVEAVVDAHSGTTYRVFMLGFAPGFAYLGTLPASLQLPRRAEPRLRVPSGSVAIAAAQTAVYPHSTAGGWHLLGRTDTVLWDRSAEPPARLRPGDRVRFVPV
ncbi:MAG: allophanate hydrolase subunit 1, partial [Chloroflexota bacterium]